MAAIAAFLDTENDVRRLFSEWPTLIFYGCLRRGFPVIAMIGSVGDLFLLIIVVVKQSYCV